MGKSGKEKSTSSSNGRPPVVVSEAVQVNPWVKYAVTGVGVLLLAGVVYMLLHLPRSQPRVTEPLPPTFDTTYVTTDTKDIPLLLMHDYGLTVRDAERGAYGDKVKTSRDAEKVGIALTNLGKPKAAQQAYDLAVRRAKKNGKPALYMQQMLLANQTNDLRAAKMYHDKAKAIIDTWPKEDREEALAELKSATVESVERQGQ